MGGPKTIALSSLSAGQRGVVRELQGGHRFISRLAVLGFTPGAEVLMVRNPGRGPLIVQVRDTRIALGQGEARRIFVSPSADGNRE
ncbi:MAG: ferrous iron transport protein A [Chloroflexi bacterium]|nr:MAG: ferrous iron transport protein A [Chloroflexota bacterium]